MVLIEVCNQVWSGHLRLQNPRVFRWGETFSPYEELKVSAFSMEAGFDDLLDFPFGFTIDNVRWWAFVVGTVSLGFSITGQTVDVEDWVDFHRWG